MPDMDKAVEDGKKAYAGYDLAGQTLGIVGLGKIGTCVFRRIVTARFGIVTAEFGSVTDHFGDVTDRRLVAA